MVVVFISTTADTAPSAGVRNTTGGSHWMISGGVVTEFCTELLSCLVISSCGLRAAVYSHVAVFFHLYSLPGSLL